jgi:Cu(I)/Ag(I) efflux system membrane fusion protein
MKRKWKYGKGILHLIRNLALVSGLSLFIFSCHSKQEPAAPSNVLKTDLEGLVKPVNSTVFSTVKTVSPSQQTIHPVIKSVGVIAYDPRLINNISMRYAGRIERLYIRFNFQSVKKGERIMDIYSPEILTEQQNLIYLFSAVPVDQSAISASKQKLKFLGLTDEQLLEVESKKLAINPLPVYSPYTGHIHDVGINNSGRAMPPAAMNNNMSSSSSGDVSLPKQPSQIENLPSSQSAALTLKEGMYVQGGQAVFAVYAVSDVWAVLDIYPNDAGLIRAGDKAIISSETKPGDSIFSGISYIEPVTGANASTIKARVYLKNAEAHHLKIGALLTAEIFPQAVSGLWVPKSAVVDLGNKKVVFVQDKKYFRAVPVRTGITTESFIQIVEGLKKDEKLAANAQYLVDSESFIKTLLHD